MQKVIGSGTPEISEESCYLYVRRALTRRYLDIKLSQCDDIVSEIHHHCNHVGLAETMSLPEFCDQFVGFWEIVYNHNQDLDEEDLDCEVPDEEMVDYALVMWQREYWGSKYSTNNYSLLHHLDLMGLVKKNPFDFKQFNEGIKRTFSEQVSDLNKEVLEKVSRLLYNMHFKHYGVPNCLSLDQCLENLAESFARVYSKRLNADELCDLTYEHWFTKYIGASTFYFNNPI